MHFLAEDAVMEELKKGCTQEAARGLVDTVFNHITDVLRCHMKLTLLTS